MSNIQIFENAEFGRIRSVEIDNEPWFVGKDVAEALGYTNTRDALLKHVDEEDKGVSQIATPSGIQPMTIINESGLYSLTLSSKLESAKKFKRWVTSEVLPSIRKHDGYLTDRKIEEVLSDPDTIIKLALDLKAERERRKNLETKVEEDAPKVVFANAVATSKQSVLIGVLAKLLKQNGLDIGQNRLFKLLREDKFLCSRNGGDFNMPTQKSMEKGLFEIKVTSITHADGRITVNKTPKVTGKGQVYFIDYFMRKFHPARKMTLGTVAE